MSGLLDGKQLVITGVITESSIAYAVARLAQEEGAKIVLTAYGRPSLVARLARRLPEEPPSWSWTSRTKSSSPPSPTASASTSTASTASCTPSPTPPPTAWTAAS